LILAPPISHVKKDNTTNAQLENSFGHSTETQIDLMKLTEFTKLDALKLTTTIKIILTNTVTVIFKILMKISKLEKAKISLVKRKATSLQVISLR